MKEKALEFYRCEKCDSSVQIKNIKQKNENNEITEGDLECSKCGNLYPVIKGIPRFVDSNNYSTTFGYQWNIHSKTQLDSFTGIPISRNRLFQVTQWPQNMEGQTILEAGSGAGRFTEILADTKATLFTLDYSLAVEANYLNNGLKNNVHLFQGNIFSIPLPKNRFDKVLCLGVIQHTPDPEKAFKNLTPYVRPGGELAIDVYTKRLISLLQWKYLLRPITKRMNKESLYRIISMIVPLLLPLGIILQKLAGRFGAKMIPISVYSDLGLTYDLHKQWSILDTFDMYSPAHDHPQSLETVRKWFEEAGFENVVVEYGLNGVIGRGRKPKE